MIGLGGCFRQINTRRDLRQLVSKAVYQGQGFDQAKGRAFTLCDQGRIGRPIDTFQQRFQTVLGIRKTIDQGQQKLELFRGQIARQVERFRLFGNHL